MLHKYIPNFLLRPQRLHLVTSSMRSGPLSLFIPASPCLLLWYLYLIFSFHNHTCVLLVSLPPSLPNICTCSFPSLSCHLRFLPPVSSLSLTNLSPFLPCFLILRPSLTPTRLPSCPPSLLKAEISFPVLSLSL